MTKTLDDRSKLVSRQLIRSLRGRRSQAALSRRLGYRTNVVQRWEAGRCFPTAARFFQMCERVGVDLEASFTQFHGRRPEWLDLHAPDGPQAVIALLQGLRGRTPLDAREN
ncbi:MAG: helix-turn-helix domain-containing protein [Myxococcales bacterium]|nr:helix-turn-helix domain-containing protein [Myxococcales bacterium]